MVGKVIFKKYTELLVCVSTGTHMLSLPKQTLAKKDIKGVYNKKEQACRYGNRKAPKKELKEVLKREGKRKETKMEHNFQVQNMKKV